MQAGIAPRPRHPGIYLSNHPPCFPRRRKRIIHRNATAHITVPVRRRNLYDRNIQRHHFVKKPRNLAETAGRKISSPFPHSRFRLRAQEKGIQPKMPFRSRFTESGISHGHHLHDLHVPIIFFMFDQHIRDRQRHPHGVANDHPVSRMNQPDRLSGRHPSLLI